MPRDKVFIIRPDLTVRRKRNNMDEEEEYKAPLEAALEAALSALSKAADLFNQFLLVAIQHSDGAAVQKAIQFGANVNCVLDFDYGEHDATVTPLMVACQNGYTDIVRILLDAGANARWRNRMGRSAMYNACLASHLPTIEMLLNHDKDLLEIANERGRTPLFVTVALGAY